jgi:enoyl-CoA hydratase
LSDVAVSDEGRIRLITLKRPERKNALTRALLMQIEDALLHPAYALAVVITGKGNFFSAGADLKEIEGSERDLEFDDLVGRTARAAQTCHVPVIAAIEGGCLGAAFDFAMACDVRVAGRSATFGLPAARLGLLYNPASIDRMLGEIGRAALARLLLTADRVSGEEALALGLASTLVEDGGALDRALALAEQTVECDPDAISTTKELLRDLSQRPSLNRWESIRRELVSSDFRKAALAEHPARGDKEGVGNR